jgi:hypothetical protein
MYVKETGCIRIHLNQNRDQWRALVSTVIKLVVPMKDGVFLNQPVSQGFCSME